MSPTIPPIVTDLSELELLKTYKRQPTIEKRFSQLKADFEVAPVYLKAVHRIYPESRACRWPTARRVLDLYGPIQRHALTRPAKVLVTGLARVQRRLLNLLGLPLKHYGH